MIPHIHTLFEFISIPYENQHQTLNIKKIDRGQIRFRDYWITLLQPMDFGVKRSRSQCKDYWKRFLVHNCFPLYTYLDETSHAVSPWVEYEPYGLWGQKFKGQGHNARITEKGFWRITASPIWCITWRVWIDCRWGYFVPLGQPHSSNILY